MSAPTDVSAWVEQGGAAVLNYGWGLIKSNLARMALTTGLSISIYWKQPAEVVCCLAFIVLLLYCWYGDHPKVSHTLVFFALYRLAWEDKDEFKFLYTKDEYAYRFHWFFFLVALCLSGWSIQHHFKKISLETVEEKRREAVNGHLGIMTTLLVFLYIARPNILAQVTSPACYPLNDIHVSETFEYMYDATVVKILDRHSFLNDRKIKAIQPELMGRVWGLQLFVVQTHVFYHLYIGWIWSFSWPLLWTKANRLRMWYNISSIFICWGWIFGLLVGKGVFSKMSAQWTSGITMTGLDVLIYYVLVILMLLLRTLPKLFDKHWVMPSRAFCGMSLWALLFVGCDVYATYGRFPKLQRLTTMLITNVWKAPIEKVDVQGRCGPATRSRFMIDTASNEGDWTLFQKCALCILGCGWLIYLLLGCLCWNLSGRMDEITRNLEKKLEHLNTANDSHETDSGNPCEMQEDEDQQDKCFKCRSWFRQHKEAAEWLEKQRGWIMLQLQSVELISFFLTKEDSKQTRTARITWNRQYSQHKDLLFKVKTAYQPPASEPRNEPADAE